VPKMPIFNGILVLEYCEAFREYVLTSMT
jgi:hypothetical protein